MSNEFTPIHRPPVGGEYYVFRDLVHNLIEIEDEDIGIYVRDLLRTPEVQRMRRIRQNGLGSLVYSSLEGSRFPHALGSFHVARRIAFSLLERQPQQTQGFPKCLEMTVQDCYAFSIAALLHDLGHGPLSHVWEECFVHEHEQMGQQIVGSSSTKVGKLLGNPTSFPRFPNIGKDVLEFLGGRHQLDYLLPLLSGNLDVDRLDFISRDTKSAGVTYGFHELDWIIRSFRFARLPARYLNNTTPRWVIAIDGRKGLNTLVQFLHARENMYRLVYHHKTIRAVTWMLKSLFRRAAVLVRESRLSCPSVALMNAIKISSAGQPCTLDTFLQLDDSDVWMSIKAWASDKHGDDTLHELAEKILARDLFKVFLLNKDVYQRLAAIDSAEGGQAVRKIIAARMDCSEDQAAYYYSFDTTSFDVIGRSQGEPWRDVWIMQSGALGFEFQTLRDFWRSSVRSADSFSQYLLVVHPKVVPDLASLIERLSFPADSAKAMTSPPTPPDPYILVAPLGSEGAWKEVWIGAYAKPGSVPEKLFALKRYKTTDGQLGAVQRDVVAINLLAEAHHNLSTPQLLSHEEAETWILETLWTGSLEDLIKRQGARRDILEILEIAYQLFSGLEHLHEHNLRHTDIKPDNCGIVGSSITQKHYVLGDFGCVSSHPNKLPTDFRLSGTLRTRAPEVFQGSISLKSDVWAMAATIYALCLVEYPFMEFNAPHHDQRDREEREGRIGAKLAELTEKLKERVRMDLPPVVGEPLMECFAPEAQRPGAKKICTKFSQRLSEVRNNPNALIKTTWLRAEDIVVRLGDQSQSKTGNALLDFEIEEIRSLCTDYARFVPERLRVVLNQLLSKAQPTGTIEPRMN